MKTGDVVRLKSGGPKMTLGEVDNVYGACEWFEHNVVYEREFSVAMLEVVAEEEGTYKDGYRDGLAGAIKEVERMRNARSGTLAAEVIRDVIDELQP